MAILLLWITELVGWALVLAMILGACLCVGVAALGMLFDYLRERRRKR